MERSVGRMGKESVKTSTTWRVMTTWTSACTNRCTHVNGPHAYRLGMLGVLLDELCYPQQAAGWGLTCASTGYSPSDRVTKRKPAKPPRYERRCRSAMSRKGLLVSRQRRRTCSTRGQAITWYTRQRPSE